MRHFSVCQLFKSTKIKYWEAVLLETKKVSVCMSVISTEAHALSWKICSTIFDEVGWPSAEIQVPTAWWKDADSLHLHALL